MSTKTGRPTTMTPEAITKIVEALRLGAPILVACAHAGVGESTYHEWQAQGREDIEAGKASRYASFALVVKDARGKGAFSLVTLPTARAAQAGDMRATAWLGTHVYRDFFGDGVQRIELTGKDGSDLIPTIGILVINPPSESSDGDA